MKAKFTLWLDRQREKLKVLWIRFKMMLPHKGGMND